MEFVMPILEGAWRYVLTLRISDYLDIALMAYAIYWLLKLVGTSKVESVGKVILLFLLALMLSDAFSLNGIYFLLSHILSLGALALIVLFQPEIRRLIDQLGSSRWRSFNPFARTQQVSAIENAIAQTVLACTEMSKTRTGVLIVFEREMALDDIARTGTIVDARVSSELLKNIFFVKAAMHDGAVIMRDGRLLAGGAPPGQLFFHRIPDRIPAPEQYHSGIVLGDHHCRRVGAAHKVDVHHIPAEGIAQPNGNRRCQHNAGHGHPQTQTPAEGQPAQQDEHQTDNGRIGRIKVEPRTRFCRYPDGPAVEQAGQGCGQYGEYTMQRRKGGHQPGERRAEAQQHHGLDEPEDRHAGDHCPDADA